ncbi:MAG: N-acetylglucosamine-6-phosphate deacetylase [Eubacteriales bacterium]|nr:N-acetylglucosamine-6-phosphate deacetylase [Eubacteriales bacterium]
MWIINTKIYSEEHIFVDGEIEIVGDRIRNVNFTPGTHMYEETIDAKGAYAIPGLIDMHFHGCMGADVCDGTTDAWNTIAEYEAGIGVTAICPATMTLSVPELEKILEVGSKYASLNHPGADIVGINMEGPFISVQKKGAQKAEDIVPCNTKTAERFLEKSKGLVKIIGLAPEEGDSPAYIKAVKDKVIVSLAHTNAEYEIAVQAIDAGASHIVHLYNAMTPMNHRNPGVVGAAADRDVTIELICDGVHIHPAMVRNTFKLFGADRIMLISDSMRATGLADGVYTLGGQDVQVQGKNARLTSDGAIAGSVTSLPECVRCAVKEMGIPLETAVRCATENPAKRLGVWTDRGSISVGKIADICLWDKELNLVNVIKSGKMIEV